MTQISQGGRIVIPGRFRKALGVAVGSEVVVRLEGNTVRVMTTDQVVKEVQDEAARHIGPGRSLVDELLDERRREAADA